MASIILIVVGMFAAAAILTVLAAAVTTTQPTTEAFTVSPFGSVGLGCPSTDTLSSVGTETVLPERHAGEWRVTTMNSLAAVESFMDYLENNQVTEREMHVLANNSFAVRWKAVA
ncbi:MAG TPA: hypothetical protein VGJ05_13535 [Fimbriiglobus sp.]|jgi:hypothetical protein